jgi:hypothetical protein
VDGGVEATSSAAPRLRQHTESTNIESMCHCLCRSVYSDKTGRADRVEINLKFPRRLNQVLRNWAMQAHDQSITADHDFVGQRVTRMLLICHSVKDNPLTFAFLLSCCSCVYTGLAELIVVGDSEVFADTK